MIGGVPFEVVAFLLWGGLVSRRRDLGIGYAGAALVGGAGIGVLAAATPAGTPVPVMIIGAALVAVGVLLLGVGMAAAAARRRAAEREDRTMREGMPTTATVTDTGFSGFGESTRVLSTVTFTFTDLQGRQRWVQKAMVVEARAPIAVGQETRLWYDAADPGDLGGIVVELARDHGLRRG